MSTFKALNLSYQDNDCITAASLHVYCCLDVIVRGRVVINLHWELWDGVCVCVCVSLSVRCVCVCVCVCEGSPGIKGRGNVQV